MRRKLSIAVSASFAALTLVMLENGQMIEVAAGVLATGIWLMAARRF